MGKKRRKKLNCCEKCQNYWTCEEKWYRGENGEENICCSLCNFYESSCGGASSPSRTAAQKASI